MPGCRCTCLVACLLLLLPSTLSLQCDPLDHACRARQCHYQPIWLIPGRADASCTRPGAKRVVEVDPAQVVITPEVVKMPGCFTVQMNNVHVLDHQHTSSLFAKAEYQWWNVNQFSHLKCQNASNNGCGGYGNNCYYCDICESLSELGASQSRSTFAQQLKGINCPNHAGLYTFRKEFCFNDWSSFDTDGDCELDFFQGDKLSDYRSALASLQQIGYGTVVAKLRLAFNATGSIDQKKAAKESQIEESVLRELEERRSSWDVNNGQFDRFRDWYVQYRKNLWHRDDYLPWLLYENEIACLRLTFDVCERMPQRMAHGPRYTCASP